LPTGRASCQAAAGWLYQRTAGPEEEPAATVARAMNKGSTFIEGVFGRGGEADLLIGSMKAWAPS
jgi:hypothetical protein